MHGASTDSVVDALDSRVAQYEQLNTAYLATSQEVKSGIIHVCFFVSVVI